MDIAAQIALAVMVAGSLIDAPGFGFDSFRLPFMIGAGVILLAAGVSRRDPDRSLPRGVAIAAAAFGVSHLLSVTGAVDGWAAAEAILPVGAGLALFLALSRGWVKTDHLFWMAGATAVVYGVAVIWQRGRTGVSVPVLGNTNYAGCMAALLAVLSLAGLLAGGGRGRRLTCAAGAILATAALWATDSRAGIVGLAAGTVALAILAPGPVRAKLAVTLGLLVCVGAISHQRIATIVSTQPPTNRERLELWKGTLNLVLAHPVFGGGAGNFRAQYPPYRLESEAKIHNDGKLDLTEAEDPHNTHLSVAADLGFAGAASWIALLAALAAAGWRQRKDPMAAAGLAGLAAFVAAGSFNTLRQFSPFDAFFWLFAGLVASGGPPAARRPGLAPAVGMIAGLCGIALTVMWAAAQKEFYRAMKTDDPSARGLALGEALRWRPSHWRAHYELANVLRLQAEEEEEGKEEELCAAALEHYRKALERVPWQLQALNFAGSTARSIHREDEALRWLKEAERIAPWYYLTQYNLAFLERTSGDVEGRLMRCIMLRPNFSPAHFWLAETYLQESEKNPNPEERQKRKEMAAKWYASARKLGFDVASMLLRYHPDLEEDPALAPLYK